MNCRVCILVKINLSIFGFHTDLMKLQTLSTFLAKKMPSLLWIHAMKRIPLLYKIRSPLNPISAWINLTDNCNMGCIMCNQWQNEKTGEMTTKEWIDVISQLHSAGIKSIVFGGGEPLLFKELDKVVAHGHSLGIRMGITTSGYTLTERRLHELLDAGVTYFSISIDGVGESYEKIRNRKWENVLRAAKLLATAKKQRNLEAGIGFVLMKQTLNNYRQVEELANSLDLPLHISLLDSTPFFFQVNSNSTDSWIGKELEKELSQVQQQMIQTKNIRGRQLENSFADIDFIASYFRNPLQPKIPCSVSQARVLINGMGEVYGGCWSMGHFGNLHQQSLTSIIHSKKYTETHKEMFYKDCPGCSCGYNDNNYNDLPTQIKEAKYRLFPKSRNRIGKFAS